jgi:O-antigen ligase
MNNIFNLIPFFAIAWFIFFIKKNQFNNLLTGLIFVSYLFFATNYQNFGMQIDIFRYVHRFIGIIAILFLLVHIVRFKINLFKEEVPILLALFLLALLFSYVGNDIYFQYYFHYVRNFIFIAAIVLYLYYFIDSNEKLDEIFNLIISLTYLLTFFSFIEVIVNGYYGQRTALFYGNPNYFAFALVPGFTLALFSEKKIFSLPSLLILFVIFASGSRAAELSAILSLLTYVYFKSFKKIKLVPILIVIVCLIFIFFDKIVTNKDLSLSRIVLSNITLSIFEKNPINGIGYGQFRKNFHKYIDEDIFLMNSHEINEAFIANNPTSSFIKLEPFKSTSSKDINSIIKNTYKEKMTHNDLLTIIAELGIIGLTFLLVLLLRLFIELKKLLLHSRKLFFTSIGIIGSSLIFSMFHNNMTSFMFWFVIFIPFIVNRNFKKQVNL